MKLNLDTIILYVQDIYKVKSFYCDILQLEIIEEDPSLWVLLNAGNSKIGLHRIGVPYQGIIKDGYKFDNNTKIVFEIEENINHAREKLLNQHVSMKEIKTFDHYDYWLCDGTDPEGNVFQLKQKKAK